MMRSPERSMSAARAMRLPLAKVQIASPVVSLTVYVGADADGSAAAAPPMLKVTVAVNLRSVPVTVDVDEMAPLAVIAPHATAAVADADSTPVLAICTSDVAAGAAVGSVIV